MMREAIRMMREAHRMMREPISMVSVPTQRSLSGDPRRLVAISGNRGNQWQSVAISGNQWQSVITQWQSEAIGGIRVAGLVEFRHSGVGRVSSFVWRGLIEFRRTISGGRPYCSLPILARTIGFSAGAPPAARSSRLLAACGDGVARYPIRYLRQPI